MNGHSVSYNVSADNLKPEDAKPVEKKEIGFYRSILPQMLAVFAKNTLALNFGFSVGFQTIAIPAMMKPNDVLYMTPDQISWFGSLFFIAIPVGCVLSGPCIHRWGRKPVMLLFCVPFYLAWWVYYCAHTPLLMYIGILLHGLVNGLLEAPILTYVAEVCEPKWRGMFASSSCVFALGGISLQFLFGNYFTWKHAALINSAFPVISFVTICFVPESPHWLASQGRNRDAEKSLQWLRGWVQPSQVKQELDDLILAHSAPQQEKITSWKAYTSGTFIKPFILVLASFAVGHFSGMATIQTYSVSIFDSFGVSGYAWTVAMGVAQLLGATACVIVLPFVGKRPVSIVSMAGAAVGLLGASLWAQGTPAVLSLLVANFFTNACSRVIPWVLIGEVFTNELRAVASGLASCLGYAIGFLLTKTYLWTVSLLTLHNLLAVYAGVAIAGAIMYFFMLPETEGKSLAEVQQHYARKGKENPAFDHDNP